MVEVQVVNAPMEYVSRDAVEREKAELLRQLLKEWEAARTSLGGTPKLRSAVQPSSPYDVEDEGLWNRVIAYCWLVVVLTLVAAFTMWNLARLGA